VVRQIFPAVTVLWFGFAGATAQALAQGDTALPKRDTLRVHELDEVVIQGSSSAPAVAPYTVLEVPPATLAQLDAFAVTDIARVVPAAHVQTNSRGEGLVYLRNAGERQVATFLDGALLNVPWDNRVDLSFVPVAMIEGLSVVQGVPPVEYGANAVGGVINLVSPSWADRQTHMETGTAAGTHGLRSAMLAAHGTAAAWRYAAALGHSTRSGIALPGGAQLAFSQPDAGRRTNTDARTTNVSARAAYRFAARNEIGLSLIYVDGAKGVAPEGHKDPAVSNVRFWRYPDWRNAMGIISAHGVLGGSMTWKGAAWAGGFRQTIDAYTSVSYDSLQSREEDSDLTLGARLVAWHIMGASSVKLALNGLTSTHRQRDLDLDPSGQPLAAQQFPQLLYREVVLSGGTEYTVAVGNAVELRAGASVDAMLAPNTGDKPAIDPFLAYGATLGASLGSGLGWHARINAGRKVRFPTLRELFGEALNRFLVNPGLKPEASLITELAVVYEGTEGRLEIVPFATFTSNTIDQQSVLVPGETTPRRQRINLRGSHVFGVELAATWSPFLDGIVSGHLTMSRARRLPDGETDPTYLSEKPDVLGRLAVSLEPPAGLIALIDADYTGRAYSLDDDNQFVALPTSLTLNARAGYRFSLPAGRSVEVYLRVENLADAVVMPQLGLPDAGRTLRGGAKASF
jgi:iron complex outermembrane receptor protein